MSEVQPADANEPATKKESTPKEEPGSGSGTTAPPGDVPAEEESIQAEEALNFEPPAARIRMSFAEGSRQRDVAGVIYNNHYYGASGARGSSRGLISLTDLTRIYASHVTSPSYGALHRALRERHVAILHGKPDTGRWESAVMALDELTGQNRETSLLITLDPAGGLETAIGSLAGGNGHVLVTVGSWNGSPTQQAQLNRAREKLGADGYLVIVADSDDVQSASGYGVEHVWPDPERVTVSHLAADLAGGKHLDGTAAAGKRPREARRQAEALIKAASAVDKAMRRWREELNEQAVPRPAEAVMIAEAVLDWHRRTADDPGAMPRTESFRMQYFDVEARKLLRHRQGMASPVAQSYLIAAAVLDGLNANDVVEGAVRLRSELPPFMEKRDVIFEEPLSRRVYPGQLVTAETGNGTVVRMQSPELARCVIETAWREYDGVREPMLDWLLSLCEDRGVGDGMRARAVQALARIAADDYDLIRKKVLDRWAESRSAESHVAAAWLLEAIVQDGSSTQKVLKLLRDWSRQPGYGERRIALRAYGTSIARRAPRDAIAGVRLSANMTMFSVLPELALREMYWFGLTAEVMAELATWPRGHPAARQRAGRALVRIAYIRGNGEDCPEEKYDLLWRLAHAPSQAGASLSQIARIWQVACLDDKSKKDAWRVLCDWAESRADDPRMSATFTELAAEMEKTAHDLLLRERIGRYRQWWDRNLVREDGA